MSARFISAGLVLLLVGAASGFLAGKRSAPKTVTVTKEVIQWREKIVNQTQQTVNQSSNENVKVVTRWRTLPSGERVVEQSQERASTAVSSANSVSSSEAVRAGASSKTSETARTPVSRPWSISAIAGVDLKLNKQFGLQVTRDLGPVRLGVWGMSTKAAGVSLGFTF